MGSGWSSRDPAQVMQPAVAQLFHMERDAPQLYLAPCGREAIPLGDHAFGEVKQMGTAAQGASQTLVDTRSCQKYTF